MKLADEKYAAEVLEEAKERNQSLVEIEWSEEEERRLRIKIDRLVMPLLMFAFFSLQLDRGTLLVERTDFPYERLLTVGIQGNIGNAVTNNFMEDVGITQGQFNVGQQLLSLGIVLWEIPSNMVLYRIGPAIWLSGQIICWG